MSWANLSRPKIKTRKKDQIDIPDNLWVTCKKCGKLLHHKDLNKNMQVCNYCGFHLQMTPDQRFELLFDKSNYEVIEEIKTKDDPLKFVDKKAYPDRLKSARKTTGTNDCLKTAIGNIDGLKSVVAVMDARFMMGSMSRAFGANFIKGVETAIKNKAPYVIIVSSGGARMQESILSLMQLVKTTVGVNMLQEAKLPYIVIQANPTTGGASASFAMIGDVHIAEKGALIAFAGRRVIEETIREKLPKEFQTAEFLKEKGMVDIVVERKELKGTLGNLLKLLMKK